MTSILITEYAPLHRTSIQAPFPKFLSTNSCASYFVVRRGNVSVPDMYNFHGIYRYSLTWGSNWRAVVAFFIGCIPPLPGFTDNIVRSGNGTTGVSVDGQHL